MTGSAQLKEKSIVKKVLSVLLLLLCLLTLVGCGGKFVNSGDTESRYRYGWKENSDGTISVKIKGKWDRKSAWRAEYDENVLTCTQKGRKGQKFTVGSLDACTTDIDFRLYPRGAEDYVYDLWLCVQGNGTGGVIVLASTSIEPAAEGSYFYETDQDGSLYFHINTKHDWDVRLVNRYLKAERKTVSQNANERVYCIEASHACTGVVELFDTETERMLVVSVSAREDGTVTVENVEERTDTSFTTENIDRLWEQLGVTLPLSDEVIVNDCFISDDPEVSVFPCGELEVTINGEEYNYMITMGEEWAARYIPADMAEETEEEETINTESVSQREIGQTPVTIYVEGTYVCAVWKQYGANFILDGRGDADSMCEAVRTVLGG